MLLSNPRSPQSNHLHTTQSMRLGICGKARRAARISISWANSPSKVSCLNCEKWAVKGMHKARVGELHVSPTAWFFQRRAHFNCALCGLKMRPSRVTAASFTAGPETARGRKDWASQSNIQKQPNNQPFLWQQPADAAVFMMCLLPPLIPMLLLPRMTKKKSPF